MSDNFSFILKIELILNIILLVILSLGIITLIIKTRYKIDISGIIILSIYELVFIIRVTNSFNRYTNISKTFYIIFLILIVLCQCLISVALYYFTFESLKIKDIIQSRSIDEYKNKMKILRR